MRFLLTFNQKADLPIGNIIAESNPVLPGDTSSGVLLSALSTGFAFLDLPAGGAVATKLMATGVQVKCATVGGSMKAATTLFYRSSSMI